MSQPLVHRAAGAIAAGDGSHLDDGALGDTYPLPPGWSAPEPFRESVVVGASVLELCGFSAESAEGVQVAGSAASAAELGPPVCRSYFELLERASIVSAMNSGESEYDLHDAAKRRLGRAPHSRLFPKSPQCDRWRPARSNGVALHTTWPEACRRAEAELVERDRVLRSWYGESLPRRLTLPAELIPEGLSAVANWSAHEFVASPDGLDEPLLTVAVVGLPNIEGVPLVLGFAARTDPREATKAAADEAVQRFGFLFGEDIPMAPPALSPTPDYHQEFFLYPPSQRLLQDWLDGEDLENKASPTRNRSDVSQPCLGETRFVDLTPPHLSGRLFVVKAINARAEPLVFGEPAPHRRGTCAARRVHPIA